MNATELRDALLELHGPPVRLADTQQMLDRLHAEGRAELYIELVSDSLAAHRARQHNQ